MSEPLATPPASPDDAKRHFGGLLSLETDCWDVHEALASGDPGFVLLDVRSTEAFAAGHADGAVSLPHRDIDESTLASYPADTAFVVYCAGPHCNGADKAALRLAELGRPVKKMIGGVTGWLDEGLVLSTEPAGADDVGADATGLASGAPSSRTSVRRLAERGHYDAETVYAIIDEAMVSHVAVSTEDGPMVLPTLHARDGHRLVLHGSAASALLRTARNASISVAITLIDGLVLARTGLHHSANYRSVVVYGTPTEVTDLDEKSRLLDLLTDAVVPGRSADLRPALEKELRATAVLTLPLDEASAKIRTGGPSDDEEDYDREVWAGVLPVTTTFGPAEIDPLMRLDVPTPTYVTEYRRPGGTDNA